MVSPPVGGAIPGLSSRAPKAIAVVPVLIGTTGNWISSASVAALLLVATPAPTSPVAATPRTARPAFDAAADLVRRIIAVPPFRKHATRLCLLCSARHSDSGRQRPNNPTAQQWHRTPIFLLDRFQFGIAQAKRSAVGAATSDIKSKGQSFG